MSSKIYLFIFSILFVACSDSELLNKSDDFWYNKIIQALDSVNLDEADDAYSSLETEHIRSPLLESATLLMIQAHMKQEDYILAEYFMDRYIQLFGTAKNKEYIEFLRIKAKYLGFRHSKRDQELIEDTLELIDDYKFNYSHSKFLPYIDTMQTNLLLAKYTLNLEIMVLYKKLDKPKAVEFYKTRDDFDWVDNKKVIQPDISFIRAMFEN